MGVDARARAFRRRMQSPEGLSQKIVLLHSKFNSLLYFDPIFPQDVTRAGRKELCCTVASAVIQRKQSDSRCQATK